MTNEDNERVERRAAMVRSELLAQRKRRLIESIALLREAFPGVVDDAERFVQGTNSVPWDFGVAMSGGDLGALRDRYSVPASRHRPHHEDVSALTDMFCRACEAIDELRLLERDDIGEQSAM
jgi:hypothetical protein